MNLGFLVKLGEDEAQKKLEVDPNWKNGWDGIDCQATFNKESAENVTFNGSDVFYVSEGPPNFETDSTAVQSSTDTQSDWTVNPAKSYFSCQGGKCRLNMHFWRMYETRDTQDHQLEWGTSSQFKAVTWYSGIGITAQSD